MNQTIETKTLYHRNDPNTSREAAEKMVESGALNRQEKWIFDEIHAYIRQRVLNKLSLNFTTKDIARFVGRYDKVYDICRKRFSGLFNKFKIRRTGAKRDGCCVWELV